MNKFTFTLVFFSGALFSLLISFIQNSINHKNEEASIKNYGIFPIEVDLELLDDGYIAMENVGPNLQILENETHTTTTKKTKYSATTEIEERNSEIEALNSLKVAKEYVKNGKTARAGRLLERAYSLLPKNADVLLCYGEYLENYQKDVILADHMYLKALAVSPKNSRALRNRRRTQKLVEELDTLMLLDIDLKQEQLMMIPGSSGALKRIKKEAYFQYIYHTAAIEGNTFTLTETRMVLETRLGIAGKSILEHNEILGLDLALKYINMTLVHPNQNMTLNGLLQIHRRVLGHSNPLDAGQLRTTQVYVSDHIPPPPTKLQVYMENFIEWLNSKEARALHPIKFAALAHYKLVYIHPFLDGNGRTARLLMNFFLMQAGYPPVIIRKQDRLLYYNHLKAANDGDTRPFMRFIAACAEKTLNVYLWATKEHLPEIEQQASNLGQSQAPISEWDQSDNGNVVVKTDCEGDYCIDQTKDSLSTEHVTIRSEEERYSGEAWLHGIDSEKNGKEYVQFKHYRESMERRKMKKPLFLFDSEEEFSSSGR